MLKTALKARMMIKFYFKRSCSTYLRSVFIAVLVCHFLCQYHKVHAQDPHGSPYNSFGIGDMYNRGFGITDMLGNAAIGYKSSEAVNLKNPASLTGITGYSHIFDMGLEYNKAVFRSDNEMAQLDYGNLAHLNLWFRLSKKWSSSFGIRPFSNMDYNITESISAPNIGSYNANYQGSGGLNEIYWAHGLQLFKNLSIGVNAGFVFGKAQRTETGFNIPNVGLVASQRTELFRKGTIDFGTQYSFDIGASNFTLGATWRPEVNMTTSFEEVLMANSVDSITTEGYSSFKLPQNIGFGISWQRGRTLLTADLEKTYWSINEAGENYEYNDIISFAVGLERRADFQSNSFLDYITYRTGFSINKRYISINNTSFNELRWTAGMSIPVKRNTSKINLGYSYTFRGTTENDLVQENYHTVTLGISMKKLWFQRSYYR